MRMRVLKIEVLIIDNRLQTIRVEDWSSINRWGLAEERSSSIIESSILMRFWLIVVGEMQLLLMKKDKIEIHKIAIVDQDIIMSLLLREMEESDKQESIRRKTKELPHKKSIDYLSEKLTQTF